ncbi:MAG TPA: penicillin acylase family protein, partial [Candidatus Baltobacteraceae bacterium]|nr:penicillin acylase family protein [Candidatus Baltobacteraceae bacterium]
MLTIKIAARVLAVLALGALVAVLAFAVNVALGMRAASLSTGTVGGLAIGAPVEIRRDGRGVPHIRARNEHDLFFAQGYVEASDRLFQLDLLRRFVYGQLSEVLGNGALDADERARVVPVTALVQAQWRKLRPHDRQMLSAFADGVNAAMRTEPAPVEFRLLMYRPRPWKAQDALAVGFATVMDLTDTWDDIAGRNGKHLPLSDPCYDAPVIEGLARVSDPTTCTAKTAFIEELLHPKPPVGSNEWAAGAAHTSTGRALLANDPHLRLQIPGVWYLVDLSAPGYHAAGAALAGTPGVILGHNDRLAWGATNGTVASLSVFKASPTHLDARAWQIETFRVRLRRDVTKRYYRTPSMFGATTQRGGFVLVKWSAYSDPKSPLLAFDALDRAGSIEDGERALAVYPGPTQNFVLADTSGRVAYT